MRTTRIKNKISTALALAAASAVTGNVWAADGTLGQSSSGQIYISLDIGSADLSLVSTAAATELQGTNSTSFPVCFSYIDSQYVNVSATDLEQSGFILTSASGEQIPYQISLGTGGDEAKVKAISNSACAEGSALQVNVILEPTAAQEELGTINGQFNFLVKSE